MDAREELESLRRLDELEAKAKGMAPAATMAPPASLADKMAGGWGGRMLQGMASPLLAATQLVGGETGRNAVAELQAMTQRGMKAEGKEGTDVYGLMGSMVPGAGIAKGMAATLPAAFGKVGTGAAIGATTAAAQPVQQTEDLLGEKAKQAGFGAMFGSALPAVSAAVKPVAKVLGRMAEPFSQSGRADILQRYQQNLLGNDPANIAKAVQALQQAKTLVPGSKPTAGEALAFTPEATGLASHQRAVSKMEGISPQFTVRASEQEAAREAAGKARDAVTKPMREAALDQANIGGVQAQPIVDQITTLQSQPGQRASDVVSKTLNAVKEKLQSLTDDTGRIDAKDLYTVRKEVGNTVQSFAKETANWDKKLTGGLEKDIQKGMDDAIESAGGTGWKNYLTEFSTRSKAISDDVARQLAYRQLAQKTNFSGAKAIHAGEQFPNLLSRPVMIANYLMKAAGTQPANEKIAHAAAQQYLDPQKLAAGLQSVPPRYQPMIEALMRQASGSLGTTVGRTAGGY